MAAAIMKPIPNATSRIFQLVRCACIESIGSLFRFDAAAPRSGFTQNVESVLRVPPSQREWRLMRSARKTIVIGFATVLGIAQAPEGDVDSILRWRNIWPYRAGPKHPASGVSPEPHGFYISP